MGAIFAKRLNCSIRNLLQNSVFERGDANSINKLPIKRKQNKNRKRSSTKLKPSQAFLNRMKDMLSEIYHTEEKNKTKT